MMFKLVCVFTLWLTDHLVNTRLNWTESFPHNLSAMVLIN